MEAVVTSSPPRLSGADLVRLSQGFSCIFWGLPVALLLAVQLLILGIVVTNPFMLDSMSLLYCFLFGAILALVCVGAYKLLKVAILGERWRRRARTCLWL